MEDFRVASFVLLLCIPAFGQIVHQDLYPGCKSSKDQPDMSYPACSVEEFLQHVEEHLPEFSEFSISTSRLDDCFIGDSNNYISVASALHGDIYFDGAESLHASHDCRNRTCECHITLQGPPESFFVLAVYRSNAGFNDLTFYIEDGFETFPFFVHSQKLGNSKGNNPTFKLTYDIGILGALSFSFVITILPDCYQELHVGCFSTASGFIETPEWSSGSIYLNNMKSCVTLHVPDNHVTMISLINIDVEVYVDTLTFYKSSHCVDAFEKEIKWSRDLTPTVIKDASALSFLFNSDSSIVETGFRLLYSFHNATAEPHQLSDGKWECNVSYFDSFRQHFLCVPESFCSDNRDKVSCPEVGLCGSNILTIEDRCYRLFLPHDLTTWNKASETCASYGGTLVVMNSDAELKSVMKYVTEKNVKKPIFLGLRIASTVRLHDMYQNTWLWADDTLAIYLPLTFHKVQTPYCAALNLTNINVVTCGLKMDAAFLCETADTLDVINLTAIALPSPSRTDMEGMTSCRHNHLTHNFLACDVNAACWTQNEEEALTCSRRFSPPVPFFTCRNQVEHVPYTLVCDFRSDCCDGSDEDFCDFPACDSSTQYECADSKQCINRDLLCNKRRDCVDQSDELRCQDSLASSEHWANYLGPPALVDFTGDGSIDVVPLTNDTCPETHYQCPGGGYCLPVYTRCNEFYDCPDREDEMDCDHYTCPGFYRCRGSPICLHEQHLCDNVAHCPEKDDELMCNFTCPDTCHCYGNAFVCSGVFQTDNYTELRYVDANGTGMKPDDFLHNKKLIYLSLKNCGITSLRHLNFPNLHSLDLSHNDIRELSSSVFRSLKNLVYVSLAYNSMMSLDLFLYNSLNLSSVQNIHFSGIPVSHLTDTFFSSFPKVQLLNMSGCGVKKITERGFQSLKKLRTLDIRGCTLETFYPGVFEGLNQLEVVYADNYQLCCAAVLPEKMTPERCFAPTNEISSCDALLRKDVYRVFLTLYAILALIGNLGSFVYRVCVDRSAGNLGYEVFVTHLSGADFLMGVYLAIIGIADRVYFGNYRWNDEAWKHSVACKFAGFLSFVSSEVSAYLICLITLERFLVISFPHKNIGFNRLSAHVASVGVWLIGLILALVPLLPMTSHWNFYSQSGICIPLPITRKRFAGSDYAFGVLIVMNFVLFLIIAFGQFLIYRSIHVNTVNSKDFRRKARDSAIARRLLAVVMTDFICWFPIGVLGLMARSGVPVSSEINVAIAIFVLPFNSALNPFLYTINIVMEKRRKASKAYRSGTEDEVCSSQNKSRVFDVASEIRQDECNYSKEEALQLFRKLLEKGLLTPDQIRKQVWEIYEG